MEAFPLLPEAGGPAGSGALHNMSAPPIMRIAIRPLEVPGAPRDAMETRLRVPGYHCLARVDLEALLREGFADAAVQDPRHRLAALILLARGEPAGPECPGTARPTAPRDPGGHPARGGRAARPPRPRPTRLCGRTQRRRDNRG